MSSSRPLLFAELGYCFQWRNEVKFEMARGPAIQTMAVVGTCADVVEQR
jgi:hypothetical protein